MPKPLLTDDIVERARHDRERLEEKIRQGMQDDEQLVAKYDAEEARLQKQAVYKSRRIENAKTKARGRHLLRYLFILWAILIAMIIWILSPWS
jgi:hypothetical protein